MPIYAFVCPECGNQEDLYYKMADVPETIKCFCAGDMHQDWASKGRFNALMKDNERWSWSLGINLDVPEEVAEAKLRHPGAVFNEKGQMRISNRKEKLQRMKEAGLTEY